MKILTCPINGPRPLSEFVFGGEVRSMPNPKTADDAAWAD
ncbi:MAG: sarcosine oxidase subunit delta, partial [Gemmatimonadetes bacterium]|nr:sarcosine oxidase subunit delta [Gemmatimonadota bacterium]